MKQITIVAPSQDGLVAHVTQTLGNADINIESIDAMNVQVRDVVVLTVNEYDRSLLLLRDAGYDAFSEDAQIVNIRDEPGALANITKRLYDGGVHIRSIRLLYRQFGEAIVAVAMDSPDTGMALIEDLLINTAK